MARYGRLFRSALAAASPSAVAQSGDSALKRNVPAIVAEPLLDVAAGARHFERLIVVLQQDDVIGEPAEAAQHHLFIARQPLAGPQRRVPLALQNGDVIEHFDVEFSGYFFGGSHDIPCNADSRFGPAASNAAGLNAV